MIFTKNKISLGAIFSTIIFSTIFCFSVFPNLVIAQPVSCGQPGSDPATCIPTGSTGPVSCGQPGSDPATCIPSGSGTVTNPSGSVQNPGACPPTQICNPLESQSITEFLLKIIDVLLIFALPIIIIYIMYAGYLFVTAAGNSETITRAKTALLWSIVGGVIALGAKLIIEVIQGTITAF